MKQPAAWLISKFMMDAFFAKQQSLTLINVILGPSIVGKNMEFPLQVNLCQKPQYDNRLFIELEVIDFLIDHGSVYENCKLRTCWLLLKTSENDFPGITSRVNIFHGENGIFCQLKVQEAYNIIFDGKRHPKNI